MGVHPKLVHQHRGDQEDGRSEDEGYQVRYFVAISQAVRERTRLSAMAGRRVLDRGGSCGHATE
jgi:hypothetical protein